MDYIRKMNKILIIDDDIEVCKQIKYSLQSETILAYYAASIHDALLFLMKNECSLIILETRLADVDSTELLITIRGLHTMPILVLSDDGTLKNKKIAYHSGADDFLQKPFAIEECLLKAQALMRRYTDLNGCSKRSYTTVNYENLTVNLEQRKAFLSGRELELTGKEFGILHLLTSNPKRVFTYEQIYETVWKDFYMNDKKKIVNHVWGLRKKMYESKYIEAVHDVGYRFHEKKE